MLGLSNYLSSLLLPDDELVPREKPSLIFGAIAGDMIGSVYEWCALKKTNFRPLFHERCVETDDSILTIATMEALLDGLASTGDNNSKERVFDYASAYRKYARKYPDAGYGLKFKSWSKKDDAPPYNSWGNGSAMRVSPIGWAFDDRKTTLVEAKKSAEVTHNHPEGIKGAQAVALAIYLARTGSTKDEIKKEIEKTIGYDLSSRTIDEIRPDYKFDLSSQGSVPEAIMCFLESNSVEKSARLAVSLGGDADTQACIACSIAEAYYGKIEPRIEKEVRKRLSFDLMCVLSRFGEYVCSKENNFAESRAALKKIHLPDRAKPAHTLGAIAGDMIGSVYEFNPTKDVSFSPLFHSQCMVTDDSILTIATMEALMEGGMASEIGSTTNSFDYAAAYRKYARKFPHVGYGPMFKFWGKQKDAAPYNSWGNGSAMRVSPIGWAFDDRKRTLAEAKKSAEVTHNHPEGIKGAQAVALAIYLARTGSTKMEIKREIEHTIGYDLSSQTIADIRPTYEFDVSCQGSVPEAILCFLGADSVESAARLAVSLGGDADTQACIACSIAEAYYGGLMPEMEQEVKRRLDPELLLVVERFGKYIRS